MAAKTNNLTKKPDTPVVKKDKSVSRQKSGSQQHSAVVRKSKTTVAKALNPKPEKRAGTKKIKKNEDSGQEKLSVLTPSGRKDQSFFQLVYEVARQIPKGRVTSYGAIATCLGTKLSARMVGWAMNGAHHITPGIPAHRVVNRNGMLSGKNHFETPDRMKELLEMEGTLVVDDTVVNFKEKFWDPASGF
jgi:methylated-DNA-protein-cysteine methyltransferase-like protein